MKRSPAISFLYFLLVFSVGSLAIYADSVFASDGSMSDLSASINPGIALDNNNAGPDLFTGTMRYSVPILVPAGRKGMDPKLALTYQSSQQNGWLGVGWELEVGSIERSTKKGVDYNVDRYILRMAGAVIDLIDDNGTYRAKIEGGFLRIRKLSGSEGDYWELTHPTGMRLFYGRTANSRQDNPADSNQVFKWCLDRAEDTNGNYMKLSYTKDQGQIYLDLIEYTGNDNASLTPTNTVKFTPEPRNDVPAMYTTNFSVRTASRLKTIAVFANGNLQRKYELLYTESSDTGRSLLSSIVIYGKDGVQKLKPIQFAWSQATKITTQDWSTSPYVAIESVYPPNSCPYNLPCFKTTILNRIVTGDFNGDGKIDIASAAAQKQFWRISLSASSGFVTQEWSTSPYNAVDGVNETGAVLLSDPASGKALERVMLGDYNGDGKTDIAHADVGWKKWNLSLSTGSGFTTNEWSTNEYYSIESGSESAIVTGDFDGDGKTDIAHARSGWGKWHVSLSTGDGFTTQAWPTSPYVAIDKLSDGNEQTITGDFNGDGKQDVAHARSGWNKWRVSLSTGAGFVTTEWSTGTYYALDNLSDRNERVVTGDFNGDGKTDVARTRSGWNKWLVSLSTGNGFNTQEWSTGTYYAIDNISDWEEEIIAGDFNGDGLIDIAHARSGWGIWRISISTGSGFITVEKSTEPYAAIDDRGGYFCCEPLLYVTEMIVTGDFSGNGTSDIAHAQNWWGAWRVSLEDISTQHAAKVPDLLISISNGLGGTTNITYIPSTAYNNTVLPFPVQTVSAITTNDGNGNVTETKYEYAGGYHHIGDRDFRGFNHVTVTGPAGPHGEQVVTETWFHQGNDTAVDENDPSGSLGPMKGRPYRTRIRDASLKIYSETTTSYQADTNANDGYFNPPDEVITYNCDGAATTCDSNTAGNIVKKKFAYDSFGNVAQEEIYDLKNSTAPLFRTTKRTFTTDSIDNYLVGLPKDEKIFEGAGTEVSSTKYYYDDPSDCSSLSRSKSQSPTKGNVTAIVRWLDKKTGSATDPEVNMSYDSVGNLVCTRDANGNPSFITYDKSSNTFPIIKTNARDHATSTAYYGVDGVSAVNGLYGQVMSITDPNLAAARMEYDAFGRKTKVVDPYGANAQYGTVSYFYNDDTRGNVGQQRITTYTATDYATSTVTWSEVYFDGFGRTIKTRALGPDNKVIVGTTAYDARGAVSESSLPSFEGSSEQVRKKSFKYDAVGRVREIINPDGTKEKACYLYGVTGGVDAAGHRKRQTKDVFGRLIRVDEYDKAASDCTTDRGTPYAFMQYQYDVMGNLRFVTDAENNQTEMRYDSLGRKIFMRDPDMSGFDAVTQTWRDWTYTYDANGNLVSQTDAKGQTIQLSYDKLNRVILKDYPTGTDVTYAYDDAPDSTATTYPIGRLSTMADASGTTKYYYDKLGRPTTIIKKVDDTNYDFKTTYNALGKPTSITYPYPDSETVSYVYNAGGLLSQVSGAGVNYATYENYNALGQPGTITYGNGVTTSYQFYSSNNRLQSIVTKSADEKFIDLSYDYYPVGSVQNAGSLKDIVDNINSAKTQLFQYDGLDRLQQQQSGNVVRWYDYTPIGNIKLKEGITYDYTGPKPHAVKSTSDGVNNKTYSYDDNGNMTSESVGSVAYRSITYNYDNMPQTITINNTSTTSFVYDGAGARVKKVSPSGGSIYLGKLYECNSQSCTKYIFAGDTRIAMKNSPDVYYYHHDHLGSTVVVSSSQGTQVVPCSNQRVKIAGATPRYFSTIQAAYGAAVDGDVIQTLAEAYFENLDLNRNISVTLSGGYDCSYTSQFDNSQLVGMISDNSGTVKIENFEIAIASSTKKKIEAIQYLPFGEASSDTGFVSANHKYTSQEYDAETGLYYYNARYYNPNLGRFISPDSIVPDPTNPQTFNRYSYVINNPLQYTDPTGHFHWSDFFETANSMFNMMPGFGYYEIGAGALTITASILLVEDPQAAIHVANLGVLIIQDGIRRVDPDAGINFEVESTFPVIGGGGGGYNSSAGSSWLYDDSSRGAPTRLLRGNLIFMVINNGGLSSYDKLVEDQLNGVGPRGNSLPAGEANANASSRIISDPYKDALLRDTLAPSVMGLSTLCGCVSRELGGPPSIEGALLDSAGPGLEGYYTFRAWQHAATTPSTRFGTPYLLYPAKSSIYQGLMRNAGRSAGVAAWMAVDYYLWKCVIREIL